jgi:hypothetical protein
MHVRWWMGICDPGRAGRRAAALALLGECAQRIRPAPLAALPRLAVNSAAHSMLASRAAKRLS